MIKGMDSYRLQRIGCRAVTVCLGMGEVTQLVTLSLPGRIWKFRPAWHTQLEHLPMKAGSDQLDGGLRPDCGGP